MDTVTYPDSEAVDFLNRRCAALRCNVGELEPGVRELIARAPLQWTPTLLVLDRSARELRRAVGFLPPSALLAELWMAAGLNNLRHGRNDEARACFQRIIEGFARGAATPEALYWDGIAAYRSAGQDREVLRKAWTVLWERYPASTWADRAAVFPDQVTARYGVP